MGHVEPDGEEANSVEHWQASRIPGWANCDCGVVHMCLSQSHRRLHTADTLPIHHRLGVGGQGPHDGGPCPPAAGGEHCGFAAVEKHRNGDSAEIAAEQIKQGALDKVADRRLYARAPFAFEPYGHLEPQVENYMQESGDNSASSGRDNKAVSVMRAYAAVLQCSTDVEYEHD